jgi:hypothetical protein
MKNTNTKKNETNETTKTVTEAIDAQSANKVVEFVAETSIEFGLGKGQIVPNLLFAGVESKLEGKVGLFTYVIQGMEVHFSTVIPEDMIPTAITAVFEKENLACPLPKQVAVVQKRIEAANIRSIKRARDYARHVAGLDGLNAIKTAIYWDDYALLHGQSFNSHAENVKFMKKQFFELKPLGDHAKLMASEESKAFKIFCDLVYEMIKEDFITDQEEAVLELQFIGL